MLQAKSFFIKVIIFTIIALLSIFVYHNQQNKEYLGVSMSNGFQNLQSSAGGGGTYKDLAKNPMPGEFNIFSNNDDKGSRKNIIKFKE